MEQLTTLPRPGNPGAMEPWALPTWQSWTPGRGGEPGNAVPSVADTPPAALQLPELRSEESSEPKGARSSGPIGGTDPEEAEACLPSLGQQASSSGPACQRPEDEEVEAFPKAKLNMGFGDRPNLELLRALGELRQRCAILKEENQMLVRLGDWGAVFWLEPGPLPQCPPHPMNISPSGGSMEVTKC